MQALSKLMRVVCDCGHRWITEGKQPLKFRLRRKQTYAGFIRTKLCHLIRIVAAHACSRHTVVKNLRASRSCPRWQNSDFHAYCTRKTQTQNKILKKPRPVDSFWHVMVCSALTITAIMLPDALPHQNVRVCTGLSHSSIDLVDPSSGTLQKLANNPRKKATGLVRVGSMYEAVRLGKNASSFVRGDYTSFPTPIICFRPGVVHELMCPRGRTKWKGAEIPPPPRCHSPAGIPPFPRVPPGVGRCNPNLESFVVAKCSGFVVN